MLGLAALLGACASVAESGPVALADIAAYERAAFDRTVTECDRLAGHPSDPERVSDGVTREDMDKPAAIEACLEAISNDPANPRLNYQLARVFGYSGLHEEGDPYRNMALKAGYPQSLFVIGYIRLENWDGRGADPCYGGELIRRSAVAGRLAGLVGFPHYALSGRFEGCAEYPVIDTEEMRSFLDRAEPLADEYYQGLLVKELQEKLSR